MHSQSERRISVVEVKGGGEKSFKSLTGALSHSTHTASLTLWITIKNSYAAETAARERGVF